MIVTLTANPSFDRTVTLSGPLERGEVLRATSVFEQAGGKGVNIARVATAAGVPSTAVLPAAEDSAFVTELRHHHIPCAPVPPTGPTRVNLTLTEPDGTTTKINSAGATVDASLLQRLAAAVLHHARGASWVVLAGSLPPGAPDGWYVDVAAALRELDVQVAVDTSGGPLLALNDRLETARPDLVKPNAEELALLAGRPDADLEGDVPAVVDAATALLARGTGAVLATLGGAGAVLVTAEGAWHASAPPTTVVSTVGAGDASLCGYLLAELRGAEPPERLRCAVAYGSATAGLPGTTLPAPHQVFPEHVTVQSVAVRPDVPVSSEP